MASLAPLLTYAPNPALLAERFAALTLSWPSSEAFESLPTMGPPRKGLSGILVFLLTLQAGLGALADSHISIQPGSHDNDFRVTVTNDDGLTHVSGSLPVVVAF